MIPADPRTIVDIFNRLIAMSPSGSFPHPVRLVVDEKTALQGRPASGRGQAATELHDDGSCTVFIAPKLVSGAQMQPPVGGSRAARWRQVGVLAHELAHAHLLQHGDETHSEREADSTAKKLFRYVITYDADDVQTVDPSGVQPRPKRLDVRENPGCPGCVVTNPLRTTDLTDAIQHANILDEPWELADFNVKSLRDVPREKFWSIEDVDSWLDIRPEDVKGLSQEERWTVLAGFRGEAWAQRAKAWMVEDMPPIVLITTPDCNSGVCDAKKTYTQIGDGRGRINFAVAMGLHKLPAVHMTFRRRRSRTK